MARTLICCLTVLFLGGTLCARHPAAPTRDYYQPVKLSGPEGTKMALAVDGKFVERETLPHAVGLLLGVDYRMRITNIPFHPGKELFPSVQILARTYPPQGLEFEFPIRIELTQDDLEMALSGKFVTRVVYLENPTTALPIRGDLGSLPSTDVVDGADPINVAATMGQPVAVVRLGGRIPGLAGGDPVFFFGCPPWIACDKTPAGRYEITLFQNMPRMPIPMVGRQPGRMIY